MSKPAEIQKNDVLSTTLKCGVLLSLLLVCAGGIIFLLHQGSLTFEYGVFKSEVWGFQNLQQIVENVWQGNGIGLIQLGILALILTPLALVLACIVIFLYQRDWLYVGISGLVFSVLMYTLLS